MSSRPMESPSWRAGLGAGLLARDLEQLEAARAVALATPADASAWQKVGFLHFRLDDLAGAESALEVADRADPSQAYTAYLRGIVAETDLDFARAAELYSMALTRSPEHAASRVALDALHARVAATARFGAVRDLVDRDAAIGIALAFATFAVLFFLSRGRTR